MEGINLAEEPYADETVSDLIPTEDDVDALLVFTDGSVKALHGGYGVHVVPFTLCIQQQTKYPNMKDCIQSLSKQHPALYQVSLHHPPDAV